MEYLIITENDISEWKDKTGELYHFPGRYLKWFTNQTQLIYYKGKLKDTSYRDKRLSDEPHYFGIAQVKEVIKDTNSEKNDYYAILTNYTPFAKAVLSKINGNFIENIPVSRISNYWRDGARQIDESTYNKIIELSDINQQRESELSDIYQGLEETFESYLSEDKEPYLLEGKKKQRFTSYYERRPENRQQAVNIHGYTCMGCGFNFEKKYGEVGKGYIHVHHIKPISEIGETIINPKTDLVVLCANCHSMVHRQKNKTLSLEELKLIIKY